MFFLIAAATTLFSVSIAQPLVSRQTTTSCPTTGIHVIGVSGDNVGSGPQDYGLLGNLSTSILNAIPGSTSISVPYAKTAANKGVAITQGSSTLIDYINQFHTSCPCSKVVIIGYSAGAAISMNTICGASAPWSFPAQGLDTSYSDFIVGAIVYGDPTRAESAPYNLGTCTGEGNNTRTAASAACPVFADRIQSYCDVDDPVCCAPGTDVAVHFTYDLDYDGASTQYIVDRVAQSGAVCSASTSSTTATASMSSTLATSSTSSIPITSSTSSTTIAASTSSSLAITSSTLSTTLTSTPSWTNVTESTSSSPATTSSMLSTTATMTPSSTNVIASTSTSLATTSSTFSTVVSSTPSSTESTAQSTLVTISTAPSSVPTTTSASSSSSTTSTSMVTSSTPASCHTALSGDWQYPHLIVPVDSTNPTTAYGTSYNGEISSTVSSIFNFDIPASYAGMTCTLFFSLPEQSALQWSSYTTSGSASSGANIGLLSGIATQSTTYANMPAVGQAFGDFAMTPGGTFVVSSAPCMAGQAVSYEMAANGDYALEYFQSYADPAIGLYLTAC